MCNKLLLLGHILLGFCKLQFPLLYCIFHAFHLGNQVVNHVGGIAGIGIKSVALVTGDQALNAFVGLHHTNLKACKAADGGITFLGGFCGGGYHQCSARILLIGVLLITNDNGKLAIGIGIHPGGKVLPAVYEVSFIGGNVALICCQSAHGICNSAAVRSAQTFQFLDIGIQLYLLHNQRTTGSKCLDLSCRESYLAGVLGLTAHILAVHNLIDEVLLSVQDIPQSGIEASFCNIGEVFHFLIDVPLAISSAVTLLYITGPPGSVQVVNGNNTLLRIHADAHLTGGADQHSNLTFVHICEQFLFLGIGVCFMDESNLLGRDTTLHQSGLDIVIEPCALHIGFHFLCLGICGFALTLRSCHITEDQLGALNGIAVLIHTNNVVSTAEDFTAILIWQSRVNHTLRIGNLSAVAGDLQHVIHTGVNILDVICSLFQLLHIILLELARLTDHNIDLAALHLGDFQTGNISQNIRKVSEQQLQLTHVLKPGETLLHTVALTAGFDLHAIDNLTKLLCPGIEGGKPQLVQQIRLQILLHDVHFAHGVHNRSCGGEDDTAASVQFLQVANLGIKVKCSLGAVLIAQAGNIGHAGGVEQVLEIVGFIDEQGIHAQLFKLNVVLILGRIRQLIDLGL